MYKGLHRLFVYSVEQCIALSHCSLLWLNPSIVRRHRQLDVYRAVQAGIELWKQSVCRRFNASVFLKTKVFISFTISKKNIKQFTMVYVCQITEINNN